MDTFSNLIPTIVPIIAPLASKSFFLFLPPLLLVLYHEAL